jgi:endonuclease/exonuclease/phosphatase family metal-dependent hydrolase
VDGEPVVLANLHASKGAECEALAEEIERVAAFVADAERCLLLGDFNSDRHAVPGFTPPIAGIDQILARGLRLERGPEVWAEERRRSNGRVLSDHAPVEAEVGWTS